MTGILKFFGRIPGTVFLWTIPCLLLVAGCGQLSGQWSSVGGVSGRPTPDRNESDSVFHSVNLERIRHGLLPLTRRADLDAVAYRHALDLAKMNRLSHISSDGRRLEHRLIGLDWVWGGENLARNKGFDNPTKEAVRGWLESTMHRENMFRPDFSETGVAALFAPNDGFTYLVQVFIVPTI